MPGETLNSEGTLLGLLGRPALQEAPPAVPRQVGRNLARPALESLPWPAVELSGQNNRGSQDSTGGEESTDGERQPTLNAGQLCR